MSALSGIDIALWDLKGTGEGYFVGVEPKSKSTQQENSEFQSISSSVVKFGTRYKYMHG